MADPEPIALSDAVHRHYVEALARRMQAAPDAVRQILQQKLQRAGADRAARPAPSPQADRDGADAGGETAESHPAATPLAALNCHIRASGASETPEQAAGAWPGAGPAGPELKGAQRFRETWSRICAEDAVAQAVARGPENAGPLNSHMLMLRTLTLMRGLSPEYLRRFLAQADALLWLEQARARLRQPVTRPAASRQGRAKGRRKPAP